MYKVIDCLMDDEKQQAFDLIVKEGLFVDHQTTLTLGILDHDRMIATGSLDGNVIKMIAIDRDYQGENLMSYLVSILISRLQALNINKYFVYTALGHKQTFLNLNFSMIVETDRVCMLENKVDPIDQHLLSIQHQLPLFKGTIGAIVMNCNPVTNGHLYLIETASQLEDHVILFLVEENRSVFPYAIRHQLLKASTAHLKNVTILPSTHYIISQATFPTYFLKEDSLVSKHYMLIDLTIFKTYFMPIFGIQRRYAGTEPKDPMTHAYNMTMRELLGEHFVQVERMTHQTDVVSASFVRQLAKDQQFDALYPLVPKATYDFLISKEGKALFHP